MYQPYFLAYVSSKFALTGFFGGLRLELEMRRSGVSVTICFLGFIGKFSQSAEYNLFSVIQLRNCSSTYVHYTDLSIQFVGTDTSRLFSHLAA